VDSGHGKSQGRGRVSFTEDHNDHKDNSLDGEDQRLKPSQRVTKKNLFTEDRKDHEDNPFDERANANPNAAPDRASVTRLLPEPLPPLLK
jgi:hypothetical protein